MNRSLLMALALGFAPLMAGGARAQTQAVVEELDRLLLKASVEDAKVAPPPAPAAKVEAAAKEERQAREDQDKARLRYLDAVQRFSDSATNAAQQFGESATNAAQVGAGLRVLTALESNPLALDLGFPIVRHPGNSLLGATLNPIEEPVRAQLNLPAGQGLVVSTVSEGGPCATVGLKSFDIIVALGDKPIGKSEDLTKALLELGSKTGALKVLRAGKRMEIAVKPVPLVTMGVPANDPTDYFIGVSIDGIDEVLQKALALPEGKGVCISEVVADSPAEKAGFKKYDLIVQIDGKPVDNAEHLRATVQKAKSSPLKIGLIRGGKSQTIIVTPVVRKTEVGKKDEEQKDSFQVRFRTPLNSTSTMTDRFAATLAATQRKEALTALVTEKYRVDLAERDKQVLQARVEELKKESQMRAERLELEIRALKTAIDALSDKVKPKK